MMIVRPAAERGRTQLDWLDSWHTFSFDQYVDRQHMGFGPLRVMNEDFIAPGGGFGMHPHRDMEIITYVVQGQLRHKDSLGNGSVISPGEIQKMSAGTGIVHSEFNASDKDPVHMLQIWIVPNNKNLEPAYEQKPFTLKPGEWHLLGSEKQGGLISIHQAVRLYVFRSASEAPTKFQPAAGSAVWIQVVAGACAIETERLKAGDGLAIDHAGIIEIKPATQTELILFELLNQ